MYMELHEIFVDFIVSPVSHNFHCDTVIRAPEIILKAESGFCADAPIVDGARILVSLNEGEGLALNLRRLEKDALTEEVLFSKL